jgi:hypothetical protein
MVMIWLEAVPKPVSGPQRQITDARVIIGRKPLHVAVPGEICILKIPIGLL